MTPLASQRAQDLLRPPSIRRWNDEAVLGLGLHSYHFFEVTEVVEAATSLASNMSRKDIGGDLAFLPADRTWIEWGGDIGRAILLERDGDCAVVRIAGYWRDKDRKTCASNKPIISKPIARLRLRGHQEGQELFEWVFAIDRPTMAPNYVEAVCMMAYAYLAMINTPRVFGRRSYAPDQHLARRLLQRKAIAGKFPLHGWTEIVLTVTQPEEAEPELCERRLTGKKCLHFVRAHLRIIGGVVVWIDGKRERIGGRTIEIPDHWRGDGALGINQSKYRVVPPQQRAA